MRYSNKKKRILKQKRKRTLATTLAFAALYFLALHNETEVTIIDILGNIATATVFGFLHLLVNSVIFNQLYKIGQAEDAAQRHTKANPKLGAIHNSQQFTVGINYFYSKW